MVTRDDLLTWVGDIAYFLMWSGLFLLSFLAYAVILLFLLYLIAKLWVGVT